METTAPGDIIVSSIQVAICCHCCHVLLHQNCESSMDRNISSPDIIYRVRLQAVLVCHIRISRNIRISCSESAQVTLCDVEAVCPGGGQCVGCHLENKGGGNCVFFLPAKHPPYCERVSE